MFWGEVLSLSMGTSKRAQVTMTETNATSLSQIFIPTHSAGPKPSSIDAGRNRSSHRADESQYEQAKMKEGHEVSSAQGTQVRENEKNDSQTGRKRAEAEKPFEKAVRKANESQQKKPEAEEGQAELAAEAGMNLQQLVKSHGEGDRPVIDLKKLTPKQEKGLADGAVLLAGAATSKGAKTKVIEASAEAGELLSAKKISPDKTQANASGEAIEAQGQQKVLLKASTGEDGEAAADQPAAHKPADATGAKEAGSLAGKAALQTEASSQGQAEAARDVQTEEIDARQLEQKTIPVSNRQDGDDTMARVVTHNAVQGPSQTQVGGDPGSSRPGSLEMDGLDLQVESTATAGGNNALTPSAMRSAQTAQTSQAAQMAGAHESEVAQSVVRQVGNYMQTQRLRSGDEMVLRLDPPELGSVKMTLEGKGNQLRMVVEASNPRTLVDLQREAPALMQRLVDSGIEVRRMEFAQSDPSGSGGSFGSLNRQGAQGQGAFDQQDGAPRPGRGPLMDASAEETASSSPAASVIGEQAINLWM